MLEAHYLRLIASSIADVYGQYTFKFYKPSAQDEAFLGFDQGWVRVGGPIPSRQLFDEIESALGGRSGPTWFWAFFLQFKCVDRITRRSSKMPNGFKPPYFRAEISLKPNRRSGVSQHELLVNLSRLPQSEVYYACPMMFSRDDVYQEPDPDTLRLVEVSTAPAGYLANQSHHITFRNPTDPSPMWCSEPAAGKARGMSEWVRLAHFEERFGGDPPPMRAILAELVQLRNNAIVKRVRAWEPTESFFGRGPRRGVEGGDDGGGDDGGDDAGDGDVSPSGAPMGLIIVSATRKEPA